MASSTQQIGFENQKLFLMMYLTLIWKDTIWSYEGKGENDGDFHIGDDSYEVKTWVFGEERTLTIGSSPPEEFKKAIFQLHKNSSKNKLIVTNRKVVFKAGGYDNKNSYLFTELFKEKKVVYKEDNKQKTKHIYKVDDLKKIKVLVLGIDNGNNTIELKNKIFDEIVGTLKRKIDDKDEEKYLKGYYENVTGTFLSSISSNISKNNIYNQIRHHYFYVICELNKVLLSQLDNKNDIERFDEAMWTIRNSDFFNTDDWKNKLSEKYGYKDHEIKVFEDKKEKIKEWTGKLLNNRIKIKENDANK